MSEAQEGGLAEVLTFEPAEVVNTSDAPASDFTAPNGVRA